MAIQYSPNFESKFFNAFINSLNQNSNNVDQFFSSNNSIERKNYLDSPGTIQINYNERDSSKDTVFDSKSAILPIKRLPGGGNTFNRSLTKKRRKDRKVTFHEAVEQKRIYQTSNLNIKSNLDRQEAGGKRSDKDKTNNSNKNDIKEIEVDVCCEFFPTLFCKNKVNSEPLVTAFGFGTLTNCGKNLLYENTELPSFQTPQEYEHLLIVEDNKNSKRKSVASKGNNADQTSLIVSKSLGNDKNKGRTGAGSDINERNIKKEIKSINITPSNKNLVPYNKTRLNAGRDPAQLQYDSEGKLIPSKTFKRLAEKVLKTREELLNNTEVFNKVMDNLRNRLLQYIYTQKMIRELRRPLNRFDIGIPEIMKIYRDTKFIKVSNPCRRKCCCPN